MGLVKEAATEVVLGAAVEVHRQLGPGLLESVYETCLAYELELRGLEVARQVPLPIIYKGFELGSAYRLDHFNVPVLRQGIRRIVNSQ